VLDRIGARPLVVHFHGPWALESAAEGAGGLRVAAKRWLERAVYRRGTRFIVLSQAFAEILEREYGVPGDAIRIVPGGVDLQRFRIATSRVEARRALGWPTDRPTVVTVRRLVRAKGIENLIDAVAKVRRVHPDLLMMIVGTGPLADDLQRRVREQGLEDSVRFTGYVPQEQLPMIYSAADLSIVPTIALEGFGLVVLESLACGTPALVTPVAGLPGVVTDLDPALVMPGTDADAIASTLGDALSGSLPLPDASTCRAYAQRFDWPAIATRVRDVYREVAS
jgi:glycosyltransferase involved in cell wall biosynthesis